MATAEAGMMPPPDMKVDEMPPSRPHKTLDKVLITIHSLHALSTLAILALSVYLYKQFPNNAFTKRLRGAHLVLVLVFAVVDLFIILSVLAATYRGIRRTFLGILNFLLGALWVALFVFILKDYTIGRYGMCEHLNYSLFNRGPNFARCKVKRAMTILAVSQVLNSLLASMLHFCWRSKDDSEVV